jgi:hypothetical protein
MEERDTSMARDTAQSQHSIACLRDSTVSLWSSTTIGLEWYHTHPTVVDLAIGGVLTSPSRIHRGLFPFLGCCDGDVMKYIFLFKEACLMRTSLTLAMQPPRRDYTGRAGALHSRSITIDAVLDADGCESWGTSGCKHSSTTAQRPYGMTKQWGSCADAPWALP